MIFVDWLTIYQDHFEGELPVVGKDVRVGYDLATGQQNYELITGMMFEGSHETVLRVRCDGCRVEVSGNPSAFSRRDNLFGFVSVADCVALYNDVLAGFGLPPFRDQAPPGALPARQAAHGSDMVGLFKPSITRVDLTENLSTPNAMIYLRNLSGYVHQGKPGHLYPDGKTVDWNGKYNGGSDKASNSVYIKYYIKETDIGFKFAKIQKLKRNAIDDDAIDNHANHLNYLETVKGYCREESLVRHEVTLKAKYLSKHGLNRVEKWSQEAMCNVIRPYQFHDRLKVEQSDILNTVQQLLDQGVKERTARQADLVFNSWINGRKLHFKDGGLSKDSFYRMRKVLLMVGVDIAQPCQIAHIPLQSVKMTVKPLDPPEWYQMPEKPKLRLVV